MIIETLREQTINVLSENHPAPETRLVLNEALDWAVANNDKDTAARVAKVIVPFLTRILYEYRITAGTAAICEALRDFVLPLLDGTIMASRHASDPEAEAYAALHLVFVGRYHEMLWRREQVM